FWIFITSKRTSKHVSIWYWCIYNERVFEIRNPSYSDWLFTHYFIQCNVLAVGRIIVKMVRKTTTSRSEEHTSELQSRFDLVCRLLLDKKKAAREHEEDLTV